MNAALLSAIQISAPVDPLLWIILATVGAILFVAFYYTFIILDAVADEVQCKRENANKGQP